MTIDKAAAIGGGVIGAGWVARLLLNGIDVSIYDPDPEASRKVGEVMKGARRAYKKMLPGGLPKEGKLSFAKTIAEAVKDADFIQESVPERLDLKHKVLAEIDLHAPANAIVGSSTSGILPSDMQVAMKKHPGAAGGRPSVQPGLSAAAGRDRRRQADVSRGDRGRQGNLCLDRHEAGRHPQGDRGLRRRPHAGSRLARGAVADQGRHLHRSRNSTTSCAIPSAYAGRRWACSRSIAWRAARPACATSWRSSGRA